jgi:RecA-family ATPase
MPRVLSATQYCDVPRPQLSWIIPSYVPKPGLVLLIGEPKAGKSFLGLQVALSVSQGKPFLKQPTVAASVLYLQLDTSETVWRRRLSDLRSGGVVLPDNLFFLHPDDQPPYVNILSPSSCTLIREAIAVCNPALIVVDVLRECHNADEQDSTAMKVVGDTLMSLATGRTLMLIHHTHKLYESYGTPNPVNAARGSSYISGKADAIWLLNNKKLQIASRFHHDESHELQRQSCGLWTFL